MRGRAIKRIEAVEPIAVEALNLPTETTEIIKKLVDEFNKLPNVMFWPINHDYAYEPFKSSHILGIKPIKKNVKYYFAQHTFTPMETINEEIISQVVLVDYIPIEGESLKEKEIAYNSFVINNERYLLKKKRCEMMGIIYIGDYRLARIYEKIKAI
jgi:hypothetical protein